MASSSTGTWVRRQVAIGRRVAWKIIALQLAAIPLALLQCWIVASLLGALLTSAVPAHPSLAVPLFALCALLRAAFGMISESEAARAGGIGRHRLRHELLQRLLRAGPALLRGRHSGELVALAVDRVEGMEGLFARFIPAVTLAVSGPLLVLALLLPLDPFAALVLGCAGLLVPLAMAVFGIGAGRAAARQFVALTRLQTRFLDRMRGIATIVQAGRAADEAERLGEAARELRIRTMRVLRVAFLSSASLDLALAASLVILAIHGARQVSAGLAPARPLFALLLVPEFFAPLRAYAAAYQDRLQANAAAEAFAELPQPEPVAAPTQPVRTIEAHGVAIAFENVSLTWDPARGPALANITLRVPPGETLIVAGPSGSGKSSLIELLLGFARPDSGSITLNGMELHDIIPAALARMTAWIGQKPLLFAGTVRDNIRFALPEASDQQIDDAARKARLDPFLATLPRGLDTLLGEAGHGLSGGQAQRVAIARAFLRDAPLLLLDEPTAHLDPATESEVLDSLKRLAIGRTVVLATHSTAALAFGGRRIDLRQGRVIGSLARGVA